MSVLSVVCDNWSSETLYKFGCVVNPLIYMYCFVISVPPTIEDSTCSITPSLLKTPYSVQLTAGLRLPDRHFENEEKRDDESERYICKFNASVWLLISFPDWVIGEERTLSLKGLSHLNISFELR